MNQPFYNYELLSIPIEEPYYHEVIEACQTVEVAEVSQSSALFMSTVFHELCTQINTISSFANFLKLTNHQCNGQEKIQYLHSMQAAIQELNQLLKEATKINWTEEEKTKFLKQARNLSQSLAKHNLFQKCVLPHFSTNPKFTNDTPQSSVFPAIPQLNQVFEFIEANYKEQITVYSLAQAVGYSPTYLSNLVKSKTGQTIHTWIVQRRMTAAQSLLLKTDWSVNRIAGEVGYPDAGHFIRQFRQIHKTTPKMWRNQAMSKLVEARLTSQILRN